MAIQVQTEAFDAGQMLNALHARHLGVGAVVGFVGYVRDFNEGQAVAGLTLEHYPGMTEKVLQTIVEEAGARWPLLNVDILHRVGKLELGEPIVFVGVASSHRQAAFEACQFVIDYLKTRAPFWKQENTPEGLRWVDSRATDAEAMHKWA